jgi:hypothetical protein
LDDLKIALKPALGAGFSDSSKISCQEWQQFHDKVIKKFMSAFVEDRLFEEIQFLDDELTQHKPKAKSKK